MSKIALFLLISLGSFFYTEHHEKLVLDSAINDCATGLPDSIYWRPDIKLHWVDFRGKPDKSSPFLAYTSTIISLKYSVSIKGEKVFPVFKISCIFNCNKSWARKDKPDLLTAALLDHEQIHFDIAELTARKLRKTLQNQKYTADNYEYKIEAIRNKVLKEGELMQELYDKETGHGTQVKEQALWKNRIEQEIKKTSAFR